jgi:hypothetical protein
MPNPGPSGRQAGISAPEPGRKPSPTPRSTSPEPEAGAKVSPAGAHATKPKSVALRIAQRTWWMPWLIGSAVFAFVVVMAVQFFGDSGEASGWDQVRLPTSDHRVTYSVTGGGKSPEIKYVVDGVNGTETVVNGDLPWRKEFTLRVGPGLGVVQVTAANNETADTITCSVSVDGNVVHQATARGPGTQVSCSSVIRPDGR